MQNIAEGSQASGTSKKSELKLTNVAARQFGGAAPSTTRISCAKADRNCGSRSNPRTDALQGSAMRHPGGRAALGGGGEAKKKHERARTGTDEHGQLRKGDRQEGVVRESPWRSVCVRVHPRRRAVRGRVPQLDPYRETPRFLC